MKKFWSKFKLFWCELGNVLTNLLCPLISLVIAFMEIFQLPTNWIQIMKKVEHWAWFACGTKDKIDEMIDQIEDEVANNEDNK